MNITFALRKENLLLTTADRAKDLNLICERMNKNHDQFDIRDEDDYNEFSQEEKLVKHLPVNPLNGTEKLPDAVIQEIKAKADISK